MAERGDPPPDVAAAIQQDAVAYRAPFTPLSAQGVAVRDLLSARSVAFEGEQDDERGRAGLRTRVVLDTSVLIADPGSVMSFDDHDVVIPLIVVVSNGFIFLTPVVAAAWLFLYLPMWRRKVRRGEPAARPRVGPRRIAGRWPSRRYNVPTPCGFPRTARSPVLRRPIHFGMP